MLGRPLGISLLLLFIGAGDSAGQYRVDPAAADTLDGSVEVFRDLPYVPGGHPRQVLDLYVPAGGGPFPLVIHIHGGGWRGGDKSGAADGEYLPALLREGFAVASINYRLSQHATFPAQLDDVRTAVGWLRAMAPRYGLDPSRFGAIGFSAGGHLAALLATSWNGDGSEGGAGPHASSRVRAVVDFYGPTDLLAIEGHLAEIGQPFDPVREQRLLGGTLEEKRSLAIRASPLTYLDREDPPFLIIHGDRDYLVPLRQSEVLRDSLTRVGVPAELRVVPGGEHGDLRDPELVDVTVAFFRRHLQPRER